MAKRWDMKQTINKGVLIDFLNLQESSSKCPFPLKESINGSELISDIFVILVSYAIKL